MKSIKIEENQKNLREIEGNFGKSWKFRDTGEKAKEIVDERKIKIYMKSN